MAWTRTALSPSPTAVLQTTPEQAERRTNFAYCTASGTVSWHHSLCSSLVREMTKKLIKSPSFGDSISLRPQDPNTGKRIQFGPGCAEWLYGPTKKVRPQIFAPDDRSCPRHTAFHLLTFPELSTYLGVVAEVVSHNT